MQNISPALVLLWDVRRSLENGQSVSRGVQQFCKRSIDDSFKNQVNWWWLSQSNPQIHFSKQDLGVYRRQLLEILELGLKGQPILPSLKGLEVEMLSSCEDEIQIYVSRLPLLSLFPLMFLIFPSMIMLLLLPLLNLLKF